ncbi:MAG TPA: dodecin domain-containing protein [Propionibacterium sp.]|jgi:flavin-binding protein dodecin|nr:dodecin domain-containing protein [Propionibacterium sp.]
MSDHVYRTIELVGTSSEGIDAAIQNAVSRASESIPQIGWFEVTQIRGHVNEGQVAHYQVSLKVGHRLEGAPQPQ